MLVDVVQVRGLAEFRRGLRDMDRAAPRALRLAGNEAAELVVTRARAGMPRRSGRAQASVKARSTQSATKVAAGSARAPYVPWLDYGGKVGKNDSASRPFVKDGRYVYPAFRAERENFTTVLQAALQRIADDAGVALDGG